MDQRVRSPGGLPMSAQSAAPSPPATRISRPRWGDARLLLGILLVMTSVVVGSRVVAGADHSEQVWAVTSDLAAGTRLTAADLTPRAVRLGAVSAAYVPVSSGDPAGATLAESVDRGELLPVRAVAAAGSARPALQQVTVPVAAFHFPGDLARGRLVDVYVTPGADSSGPTADMAPVRLVSQALVVSVEDSGSRFGATDASIGVVLAVPPADVAGLVAGLHQGPVDLVRVDGP